MFFNSNWSLQVTNRTNEGFENSETWLSFNDGKRVRLESVQSLQAEEEQEDRSDLRYVVWSCGLGFLLGVLLSALVVSSAISPFNVLSPGASLARCARSPRRFEMEGTASIGFRIAWQWIENSSRNNCENSKTHARSAVWGVIQQVEQQARQQELQEQEQK